MRLLIIMLMLSSAVQAFQLKEDHSVLEYKKREPKSKIETPPLLILLHGVGSNEDDLFPIAAHLPDNYLVVTVRAPFVQSRIALNGTT